MDRVAIVVVGVLSLAGCPSATPSGQGTGESGSESGTETTGASETETETGDEPAPMDRLRFVATGSATEQKDSAVVAINLDDPAQVPEPEVLADVHGQAAVVGPTPFASQIVVHDGQLEHARVSPDGELGLAPLATQHGEWLGAALFGDDGQNALLSVGDDPLAGPDRLLWALYADGELIDSYDITPANAPGTAVWMLDRSADSRWAAAAVNTLSNASWDLYLLRIDEGPSESNHVDKVDLSAVPEAAVPSFLSMHIDDQRLVYRREALINLRRPVAVALDDPEAGAIFISPGLPHTYSITPAADNSRLLVTTDGDDGYHVLRLLELDGPASALPPLTITDVDELAAANARPLAGAATQGHGFDALGRIWYVYADASMPTPTSLGIALVEVVDGAVAGRTTLVEAPAGGELVDVAFDEATQLLGYRIRTASSSLIEYVDLRGEAPAAIRVDQQFQASASAPEDEARFAWSADGGALAVVGVQAGQTAAYVTAIGDASGATVELILPDVEATPGFTIDHRPQLSPAGDHLLLWFGTLAGARGLIHVASDGAAAGEVVLAAKYPLSSGGFVQASAP